MIGRVYLWLLIFCLKCKKVDRFKSRYFKILPKKSEILSLLNSLKIGEIENIFLFEYSSCSAVFCVEITNNKGKKDKIVIRGEQQSGIIMRPFNTYSLEKEIFVFNQLSKLNLNVPKILFDQKIFSVPGYNEDEVYIKNFNFFFMSYVEGISIDKKMNSVTDYEKCLWIDKISSLLVKVHSIKGSNFGFIDQYQNASFNTSTTEGFLKYLHISSVNLLKENIDKNLAYEVDNFMETKIDNLSNDLKQSGYSPKISLVLFDGSAGNMLASDKNLNIFDFVNVGFFEPITDFCAHFFCMKDILISNYKGKRFWDHFVENYKAHGGILPSEPHLTQLFHIINVYFLCDAILGYKTHLGSNKREKTNELIEATRRVMSLVSPNISDIAKAL